MENEEEDIEALELKALNQEPAKPLILSDDWDDGIETDSDSDEEWAIESEEDYLAAMPKIRAKMMGAAMNSQDPKVFLPVFNAIVKMFPDSKVSERRTIDIETIMSIMTEEQLAKIEEMCK